MWHRIKYSLVIDVIGLTACIAAGYFFYAHAPNTMWVHFHL